MRLHIATWTPILSAAGLLLSLTVAAFGHCDGLDGPVVKAARAALDTGDVNLVLAWVRPQDEAELRSAFRTASAVRKLGPEAKDLADRSFFETLVRVHRAGEGAPYTGLKPAGRDLGPAIPAADRALESGRAEDLRALLSGELEKGLRERFERVRALAGYPPADVEKGRAWVKAYVEYIHYVEGLHRALKGPAEGHFEEEAGAAAGKH